MNFSNVNIGTSAGDHTGDSLRVAFDKINRNFAVVNNASSGNLTAGVSSINGQTGDVRLTVSNIAGAVTAGQVSAIVQSNLDGYATVSYVNESIPDLTGVQTMISDAIVAENIPDIRAAQNYLQSEISAAGVYINELQTNVATLQSGLTSTTAAVVTANTRMKSYVDSQVSTVSLAWTANAASQAGSIATLTANAAYQAGRINSYTTDIDNLQTDVNDLIAGNITLKSYVDAQDSALTVAWTANAASQAGSIAGANAAIVTANTAMKSYVDAQASAVTTAWTANASAQAASLDALTANAGAQSDALASLLANAAVQDSKINAANVNIATLDSTKAPIASPTFTGNATAGNVLATGFFYANGTPFVSSSYNDANVASYLSTFTGNLSAGNLTVSGALHYGNITYDNVTIDGNITAKNYFYAGTGPVTITSNNDLNITAAGRVYIRSIEGLVSNANVTTNGYFIGDGSKLSNIFVSTTYNNSNVAAYLASSNPVSIGNLSVTSVLGNVSTTDSLLAVRNLEIGGDTRIAGNVVAGSIGSPNFHSIRGNIRLGVPVLTNSATPVIISAFSGAVTAANAIVHVIGKTQGGIVTDSFGAGYSSTYTGRHARGTISSPSATKRDDRIAQFTGLGYGTTGFAIDNAFPGFNLNEAGMSIHSAEDFTDTSMGTTLNFWTIPIGANTGSIAMSMSHNGNVNIPGTEDSTNVSNGALTVKGGVGIKGNLHITSGPGHVLFIDEGQVVANAYMDSTTTTTGAIVVPNGGLGVAGNVYVASQQDSRLQVGTGGAYFPNVIGQFTGDIDSYLQVNMQNLNGGTSASSDFVATADVGTDDQYYVNIGINNSTFADPAYPAMAPLDSYLVADGGNLLVIAERVGKTITFMQGGYEVSNIVGTWGSSTLTVNTDLDVIGNIKYTPAASGDWDGTITNIKQALDEIAQRLRTAGF